MNNIRSHRKNNRGQRGFTLIEMLIALAIGAGLLFAVFVVVGKVQSKALAKDAAETLNLMVADTRAKFKSQGNFTGVTPQVLINNRIPPQQMVQGTNIVSQWNTNIGVAPVTINNANDAVRFTYTGVPSEDCSNFVQAAEGTFGRVTVAGTVVKNLYANPATPLNVATLGTRCASAQTVTIDFDQMR
jgi:prepilin-type N-terminal cleavage/methylation domain-containing protein